MSTALGPGDADADSLLLIAQLSLEDLEEVNDHRKGKGRAGSALPDDQVAVDEQLRYFRDLRSQLEDHALACSLERAWRTDRDILNIIAAIDQAEGDDRNAAVALSNGQPLPPASQHQRSLAALNASLASSASLDPEVAVGGAVTVEIDDKGEEPQRADLASASSQSELGNQFLDLDAPPAYSQRSQPSRVDCIICTENKRKTHLLRAPCGHYYCRACIVDLIDSATRDETLFPVRCCHRPFPVDDFTPYLSARQHNLFRKKAFEFGTPPEARLYCCNPTCSIFLGPAGSSRADVVCPDCQTIICTECRSASHPGDACTVAAALLELKALALAEHWQTCPGCSAMVELVQGCYHMTCRCRSQFCYLCAAPWKTCPCPQWTEARLVDDAERRVLNEHGERAAAVRPEQFRARVEQAVEQLRANHVCTDHRWRYRHGEGACEECHFYLPMFLMRCVHCQLLVCKRCSQNRL
ncbi:hypothetical protein FA95DRAFT_1588849 [Auriscalpium vulgare]|uniref:Uncharacterized protein n=1 Tax=Auriscalpium vulgare TaxID=40419 RepID=A0ACB8RVF9_9AGAM|nr:hypothetical protein FA95DRAFT_1588849 [Auriscalpium vulgare]